MQNTFLAVLAVGALAAGPLPTAGPVLASDDVVNTVIEDAPLPPTEGCNPYIVVHPPELPPDASNMNGVTVHVTIGDVCRQWQAEPRIVPSVPTPRA